jgi:hypothetical protein
MPTALGLLLRSSVLRGEPQGTHSPTRRPPRPRYPDSKAVARKMEERDVGLRPSPKLYPNGVPSAFAKEAAPADAPGLWTHYGRWNSEGTRVYNQRGKVIYELP